MSYQRRILHHGSHPAGTPQELSLTAVRSCWFELHRQGGCGSAQLQLSDDFDLRDEIELGDWISFEAAPGERWYLGRVEERSAEIPAGIRYRLAGMGVELNEAFPGGFGSQADGMRPHRYAATDLFPMDPDYDQETVDIVSSPEEVVRLLITQYVVPSKHIQYVPELVEPPLLASPLTSLKVRGEETVRSVIKDLALRAQSASWGVDAAGSFFFLRPRTSVICTLRDQQDLTRLAETCDLEFVFNRLLLTGDYVYDQQDASGDVARRVYRWRGNYVEPNSRAQFGDRRLKIWLPWIRTQSDSVAFSREFFRTYSKPTSHYFIETSAQTMLPLPWQGEVEVLRSSGSRLVRSRVETVRVLFDHVPRFRMELGPEDPRNLWPEPPQDERWEVPNQLISAGGPVSEPEPLPSSGGPGKSSEITALSSSPSFLESSALSETGSDQSERSSASEGSLDSLNSTDSSEPDTPDLSAPSEESLLASGSEHSSEGANVSSSAARSSDSDLYTDPDVTNESLDFSSLHPLVSSSLQESSSLTASESGSESLDTESLNTDSEWTESSSILASSEDPSSAGESESIDDSREASSELLSLESSQVSEEPSSDQPSSVESPSSLDHSSADESLPDDTHVSLEESDDLSSSDAGTSSIIFDH